MSDKARVLVVDDQNISRGFFEMYVRASVNYELAAGLRTAQEAVRYVDENKVDLLILDVMMQDGIDGLTAAEMIKQKHPEVKIILTTSTSETSWEQKAKDAGIESFWYKEYDEHGLLEIMERTLNGESIYPADEPNVPFGKITRADLTDREIEILRELTASRTNEEIAESLVISVNTVKRHIQNIMEKTGFESRLELAMNAKSIGLVVNDSDRLGADQ
ncbi:MAG: response regulator transcription factor [Clostridiales bacterium]|jgi:DNA-binding NarL/FixJ family response regulator|nr:response regulator transcription factor [Clostridiales bacterium]MBQ7627722.1 response regulator transcription factor [Clostridiales bacterium]MBR6210676.1 response regulator transcription factor [Clostridiales bacterium]